MLAVLKPKGICCPHCFSTDYRVVNRRYPTHNLKRRYYVCKACGTNYRSGEHVDRVTKRPWNGKRNGPATSP